MEFQFMTPTQIWEGFNPVKEPLQASVQSSVEKDGVVSNEMFFTSETAEDGRVRVYCRISYKRGGAEHKPALIVFPSLESFCVDSAFMRGFIENDYTVITVDYAASRKENELHTAFPESQNFAKASFAAENPHYIDGSARRTPWFVWAKIGRRAITLAEESLGVDRKNIAVLGIGEGAQLAWILAGIDGRIKTAVPIFGGGYTYFHGIPKYGQKKVTDSEEQRVWIAGIGAETYSRSVSCPIYFAAASNNLGTDVDRAGDILDNVPVESKALSISPRTNAQLTLDCYKGIAAWLDNFIKGNETVVPKQSLFFENMDGELFLRFKSSGKPSECSVYVSFGEIHSEARDWHDAEEPLKDDATGDLLFRIDFYDYSEQIFAFANAVYENGIVVSTPVIQTVPAILNITAPVLPKAEATRIIYNNQNGLSSITFETDDMILDESLLGLKKGPFGIKGLTTSVGRIVTYKFGKSPFSAKKDIVLQMDVYSKDARVLTFSLFSFEDKKNYTASKAVSGGEIWQRINFTAADFKSKDNKPLQTFSDIEKAVFLNAENVLFNNIIWL